MGKRRFKRLSLVFLFHNSFINTLHRIVNDYPNSSRHLEHRPENETILVSYKNKERFYSFKGLLNKHDKIEIGNKIAERIYKERNLISN